MYVTKANLLKASLHQSKIIVNKKFGIDEVMQRMHHHCRQVLNMCIFTFLIDEDELEPSSNIEDMSAKSAETIILVFSVLFLFII